MTRIVRTASAQQQECTRCGAEFEPKTRRGGALCRVCATRSSYAFLEEALANRRKRAS